MNDRGDIDAEAVLKEISGYSWPERRQIQGFNDLKDDGSTACGSWIYCGAYPAERHNQSRARDADGPAAPGTPLGWAFAWPANRRLPSTRPDAPPADHPLLELHTRTRPVHAPSPSPTPT